MNFQILLEKEEEKINLATPVLNIKPSNINGINIKTAKDEERFDLVISTIPLPLVGEIFIRSKIDKSIVNRYKKLNYVACVCVIFKNKKKKLLTIFGQI